MFWRHDRQTYPSVPELEAIDAALARAIAERYRTTGENGPLPDDRHLEDWAKELDIPVSLLHRVFWGLDMASHLPPTMFARRSDIPQGILPIMRTVRWESFHFSVTHAVQYADASIVSTVLVDQAADNQMLLEAEFDLAVAGPGVTYTVQRENASGPPPRLEQTWRVEPRLPESVAALRFTLMPGAESPRLEPKRIPLNGPLVVGGAEPTADAEEP